MACGNDPCTCKSSELLPTLVALAPGYMTAREKERGEIIYVDHAEMKRRKNIVRKAQFDKFMLEAQMRTINEMRAANPRVSNKQIRKELRERGLKTGGLRPKT